MTKAKAYVRTRDKRPPCRLKMQKQCVYELALQTQILSKQSEKPQFICKSSQVP